MPLKRRDRECESYTYSRTQYDSEDGFYRRHRRPVLVDDSCRRRRSRSRRRSCVSPLVDKIRRYSDCSILCDSDCGSCTPRSKPADDERDRHRRRCGDCERDRHACRACEKRSTVVDVVDQTKGPLTLRHGQHFTVTISASATAEDLTEMLAPDKDKQKIVVRWRNGSTLDLASCPMPLQGMLRMVRLLEVQEKKPKESKDAEAELRKKVGEKLFPNAGTGDGKKGTLEDEVADVMQRIFKLALSKG
ncbi:hypothetical protein RJ55_06686 [Drechmeria coniospora]|nr:hypothetical protein RJ55_06686 [Drechmeria coniospora]